MKCAAITVFVFSALLLGAPAGLNAAERLPAETVHVFPLQSDAATGTSGEPAMSLEKALESGTHRIVLHAGTYYLEKPLSFDAKHSGLTLSAALGETVILSGGRKLTLDWKASGNGTSTAIVPAEIASIDSLWIGGRLQHLARYPNFDPKAQYLNGGSADALSPQRVAKWKHPVGAWIHALHSAHWGGVHDRITGLNRDGTVLTEGGWGNNRGTKLHAKDRFVEGVLEELDAPGEWFFDAPSHALYAIPEAGVDLSKAEVVASRAESLIEFRGTKDAPVKSITLEGLTFTQTARTFMKTREPLLRSDWMIYRGGVIFMNHTEGCTVENCDFVSLGGNAIFLSGANSKDHVSSCRFMDCGAGGVCFVGEQKAVRNAFVDFNVRQTLSQIDLTPGPQTDDYPMECTVSECLMENLGTVEKQVAGVDINMSRRITISHCSMHHLPRAAINIGDGCWGGHIVDGCDLYDTVLESGDHGSFNSWARDRWWELKLEGKPWDDKLALLDAIEPITLRNSRWECHHGWDIDLDDGSTNYVIENNLMLDGGLKLREGYHRIVRNNLITRNGFHFHVWPKDSQNIIEQNITTGGYTGNVRLPKDWGIHCDMNFVHHPGAAVGPALKMQQISGYDAKSLQGDAKFKDPQHGDWTLAADSPAISLGFKPFPLDHFGVTNLRLKSFADASYAAYHHNVNTGPKGPRETGVHDFMGGKVKNLAEEKDKVGMYGLIGVIVLDAPATSAMAKAHLVKGDVILAWDKDDVLDFDALIKLATATPSPTVITAWHDFAKLGLWR